jgi:hypothetical protein
MSNLQQSALTKLTNEERVVSVLTVAATPLTTRQIADLGEFEHADQVSKAIYQLRQDGRVVTEGPDRPRKHRLVSGRMIAEPSWPAPADALDAAASAPGEPPPAPPSAEPGPSDSAADLGVQLQRLSIDTQVALSRYILDSAILDSADPLLQELFLAHDAARRALDLWRAAQ